MSWDELRTRVGQEAGKRIDAFRYGVERQPVFEISDATPGKFFFSPEELPERVRLLKEYLPAEVDAIIREADELCRHRFRLLGYNNLDYGAEIDWHLDIVHGKRTPLLPWFKIDFLKPEIAGDHKVTWELNRHQHLVTLGKAWALTRDKKYANEAIAQWYSWRSANPYPLGVNWASSLEVAFRAISWLWMRSLLADYAVPDSFATDLQQALALSGRHIERYLSTYFSPNTHLLGEAVALFFIGSHCPEFFDAARWKQNGWKIVLQEAGRQVRPDGVYFEQSLHYHVYALDFFLQARTLAAQNGIEIPADYDAVIRKMLTVVNALAQAGPPDGFGDDDGGRLFNPRRNRPEHMNDPLALGADLFANQHDGVNLTEEAIWLFGSEAVSASSVEEKTNRTIASQSFPHGGLYIAASDNPFAEQVVIDAGPQGTGRSGHGHADALSIKLSFGNRPWLVDSGTCAYIIPPTERAAFRGTRAHNTLTVEGLDQAQPEGPFAWSAIPTTQAESWVAAKDFAYFRGSHNGYMRLAQPVMHRRFIFHLPGNFLLVRDIADGTGEHALETSWHFAPDLAASPQQDGFVISDLHSSYLLTLLPVTDSRWKCSLEDGYVSPAYGIKAQASVLRCNTRLTTPAEHAMLLFPSDRKTEVSGKFLRFGDDINRTSRSSTPQPVVYRYQDSQLAHRMIFSAAETVNWNLGPWKTDAQFLYFSTRNQRLVCLICCETKSLYFGDECVFSRDAKLQYFEWQTDEGEHKICSSDESIAKSVRDRIFDKEIAD